MDKYLEANFVLSQIIQNPRSHI